MKKLLKTLSALVFIVLPVKDCCDGAVEVQVRDWYGLEKELPTIRRAAERNDCFGDDFLSLRAIRKAENGRDEQAWGIMNPKASTLELQAAWAAATIVKNRVRWTNRIRDTPSLDFIEFLGNRYCPLNSKVWERNVRFWFERFKNG